MENFSDVSQQGIKWKGPAILGLLAMFQAGRIFTWEMPGTLGMGPDSISEYFRQHGHRYTNADNGFLSSSYFFLVPFSTLALPFAIERFGLRKMCVIAGVGVALATSLCVYGVVKFSIPLMITARIAAGACCGVIMPLTLAFITRWFGSGASATFSVLILMYRLVYVANYWGTPAVAESDGLIAALMLVVAASLLGAGTAKIASLVDELAVAQEEIGREERHRAEVGSLNAFALVPLPGIVMAVIFGVMYGVANTIPHLLKNFWQVRMSLSSTEAGEMVAVLHLCFIIGALLTGQLLAERYVPGKVMTTAAAAVTAAFILLANTRIPAAFSALFIGLGLGSLVVTVAPAAGNFCPEYNGLIYGLGACVESLFAMFFLLTAGSILDGHPLPPCHEPTLPGGFSQPPVKIRVAPRHSLSCSDSGLASSEGYTIVFNIAALFAASLFGLIMFIVWIDRDTQKLNTRALGGEDAFRKSREVELSQGLAGSGNGGAVPERYGAAEPAAPKVKTAM